jgi:hypothetical protein
MQGIHEAQSAPLQGARELPVLRDVTQKGQYRIALENNLAKATRILVQSRKGNARPARPKVLLSFEAPGRRARPQGVLR